MHREGYLSCYDGQVAGDRQLSSSDVVVGISSKRDVRDRRVGNGGTKAGDRVHGGSSRQIWR